MVHSMVHSFVAPPAAFLRGSILVACIPPAMSAFLKDWRTASSVLTSTRRNAEGGISPKPKLRSDLSFAFMIALPVYFEKARS